MKKEDTEPFIYDKTSLVNEVKAIENVKTEYGLLSTDSIQSLPAQAFSNYNREQENLNTFVSKSGVSKFIGNDMIYVSGGDSQTPHLTGVAVSAIDHNNKLNIYNPNNHFVSDNTNLVSVKNLGRFFTPDKLGTLTYASLSPKPFLIDSKITSGELYIIPDPSVYGNGYANRESVDIGIIDHEEDVTWLLADPSNERLHGSIIKSKNLPKFYGYTSKDDIGTGSQLGISKSNDHVDFWSGTKSTWSQSDRNELKQPNLYTIQDRQNRLLTRPVGSHILYNYKTDIYGNHYAVFKKGYSLPAEEYKNLISAKRDSSIQLYYNTTPLEGGKFPSGSGGSGGSGSNNDCISLDCDESGSGDNLDSPWTGDTSGVLRPGMPDPNDINLNTCEMNCNVLWGGNSLLSGIDIDGNIDNSQIYDTAGGTLSGIADGGFRPLRTGWASPALTGTPYEFTGSNCTIYDNITASDQFSIVLSSWPLLSGGYAGSINIPIDGSYQDQRENQKDVMATGDLYGFVDHDAWLAGLGGIFPDRRLAMESDPTSNRFDSVGLSDWSTPYMEHLPDYEHWEIKTRWFNDVVGAEKACPGNRLDWDDPIVSTTRGLSGLAGGGDKYSLLDPVCSPYDFATGLHYSSKCGLAPEVAEELFPDKYDIWPGVIGHSLGINVVELVDNVFNNKKYLISKGLKNKYDSNKTWSLENILTDDIYVVPELSATCIVIDGGIGRENQFTWWEHEDESREMDPDYLIDSDSYSHMIDAPSPLALQYKYYATPAISRQCLPTEQGYDNIYNYDKSIFNVLIGDTTITPAENYNLFDNPYNKRRQPRFTFYLPHEMEDADELDDDHNLWTFSNYGTDHPMYDTVITSNRLSAYVDQDFQRCRGYMPPPVGWWRREGKCITHDYSESSPPGVDCSGDTLPGKPILDNFISTTSGFLVHDIWDAGWLNLEMELDKTGIDLEAPGPGVEPGTPGGPPESPELPPDSQPPPIQGNIDCYKYIYIYTQDNSMSDYTGGYELQLDKQNDKNVYIRSNGDTIYYSGSNWMLQSGDSNKILGAGDNILDVTLSDGLTSNGIAAGGAFKVKLLTQSESPEEPIYNIWFDRSRTLNNERPFYIYNEYKVSWETTTEASGRWEISKDDTIISHSISDNQSMLPELVSQWSQVNEFNINLIGDGECIGSDIIDYGWCEATKYKSFITAPGEEIDTDLYRDFTGGDYNRKLLPTLWSQKFETPGNVWFRNRSGTIISPLSLVMKDVLSKYKLINDSLISETGQTIDWEQVIDIDIIQDIIIIQTTTGYIFERILFDTDTGQVLPNNLPPTYITSNNSDTHKFIQHFYNEKTNTIIVGTVEVTQTETSDQLIPTLYELDIESFDLKQIFPIREIDLSEFNFKENITNITNALSSYKFSVDYPRLTFDQLRDQYTLVFTLKVHDDTSDYTCTTFITTILDRYVGYLKYNDCVISIPNNSTAAESVIDSDSYRWLLDASSKEVEVSTNKYKFDINIVPTLQTIGSGSTFISVNRITYDWGDGSKPLLVKRDAARIPGLISDFGDNDSIEAAHGDYSSPTRFTQSHTYTLCGSENYTLTATVSAEYSNFHVSVFKLKINVYPYTISSALHDIHILDTKIIDTDTGPESLLTIESEWPRFTSQILLETSSPPSSI